MGLVPHIIKKSMTQKEYKIISKALENFTKHFIKSVDQFNSEIKKVAEENIKELKKLK